VLVVVDDVVTSGATLTEAAGVLASAAGREGPPVLAAVVAATPRRTGAEGPARAGGGPADRLSGPGDRD
jgi:orotate phosphoribosyltransferase-like protein